MHKGVNTTCDEGKTMIACEVADSLTVGANQTTGFFGDVVAHSLRASGFDASEDGTGRGTPLVPVAFKENMSMPSWGMDISEALQAENFAAVARQMTVRRLTPRECERLQGFPDDYTLIPYRNKTAADGPRYKALGNSMAVPVMAWIGKRLEAVNAIPDRA